MTSHGQLLCATMVLGFALCGGGLCGCGPGDEDCGSLPYHPIESGTYESEGEPGGPYDCSSFPDGDVDKTMEIDRAANEVRITYTRSSGEQVVQVWRISHAHRGIL